MGGLFSSKTSTSTPPQTVNNDPWIGAQPGLAQLFGAASGQMNAGPAQYYPGQTVTGQSWDTQHGLNMGERAGVLGTQNMNGAGALDAGQSQATNTANGSYLWSNPAMGGASMFGSGAGVGNTAGDSQLGAIANGALLNGNPYIDATFNHAADQVGQQFSKNVMPGIASMFEGSGRYGSGQMADGMGQAQQNYGNQINNLATSIYGGNYANERNLLQQALGQWNQTGLAERGQQLSGLGMLSGQYGDERNRQMQAAGMSPTLANADYNDVNQLLRTGTMRDAYSQSLIDADKARWDFGQNAGWQNIQNMAGVMGTASPYGVKNTTGGTGTQTEGPSMFNQIMGTAGLLGGLGFFSDKNLKTDIRSLGTEEEILEALRNTPVKTWRYDPKKGGPDDGGIIHIGPMAQDMQYNLGIGNGHMLPVVDVLGAHHAAITALARKVS